MQSSPFRVLQTVLLPPPIVGSDGPHVMLAGERLTVPRDPHLFTDRIPSLPGSNFALYTRRDVAFHAQLQPTTP